MIQAGHPVINMGIGSPDLPPPPPVVDQLVKSLNAPTAHKYQSYQGLPELRQAMANFYKTQFGVSLNYENEVLPLMGSKEGIMHISMAFLNKGDQVLIPNPGYPTYSAVAKLVEATPIFYDLNANTHWLPDLTKLAQQDLSKVKLMWVNYPHMPTGANANNAFFQALVAFAKKHHILVVNDNPYSFVLNENPLSLLTTIGAADTVLELNSLSKTFNMAGWRVGMLVGAEKFITPVLTVKSNMDSGMFFGLQQGAIAALQSGREWFQQLNAVYQQRRLLIWKLADLLGCAYDKNASGMFVWAKLPPGTADSETYVNNLLNKQHIFVAPGTIFGQAGEGYIRFSLCVAEERIQEALNRVAL